MLKMDFSRVATLAQRKTLKEASWKELGDKRVFDVAKRLADGKIFVDDSAPIAALLRPFQKDGLRPSLVKNVKALADLYELIGSFDVARDLRDKADTLGAIWKPPAPATLSVWNTPKGRPGPSWAVLTDNDESGCPVMPVGAASAAPTRKPRLNWYDCSKGKQKNITLEQAHKLRERGQDVHFKTGSKVFELWYPLSGDALVAAKAADEGPIVGRKYYDLSSEAVVRVSYAKACDMVAKGLIVHFHTSKKEYEIWDPSVDEDREAKKVVMAMFAPAVPA